MIYVWDTKPDGIVKISVDGQHYVTPTLLNTVSYQDYAFRVKEYRAVIRRHCAPLPESWVIGIVFAELGFPRAVSKMGAVGVMQVTPQASGLSQRQLMNVETNIAAGCKILSRLVSSPGTDLPALASMYNAGEGLNLRPHQSIRSSWGYREDEGYIDRVVSANNEYILRGDEL
jgi:soluble lytic murein transglycosylase-like protein